MNERGSSPVGAGFLLPVAFLAAVFVAGCGAPRDPWPNRPGLKVMASFAPLYCFTAKVAGADAVVLQLLDTTSVHAYQASPRDALKLNRADILFINGLDLDDQFARLLASNAGNPKLEIYEVGKELPNLRRLGAHEKEHKHAHGHDHGHAHAHKHGAFDPHVWLGLPEAQLMVDFIRDKLAKADPSHAEGYKKRAADYKEELKALQKHGEEQFAKVKERKLVTFHDSLFYFARTFKLEVIQTIQPNPEEGAGSKRIQELANLCQKENVRIIAVEPNQLADTAANTLLETLKHMKVPEARIVEFDVLESVPPALLNPDYYTQRMKENIDKLAEALAK